MRQMRVLLAFAVAFAAGSVAGAAAPAVDHGAKVYQRCAACHLPNGQGVPGAFPALAGRMSQAAQTDEGRAYLVMTVATGIMGEIEVDGKKFRGVMPAQAGLTDADIAAVLNHALSLKGAAAAPTPAPKQYTAEEVAAIRRSVAAPTPASVHAMRAAVFPPAVAPGEK